MNRTDTLDGFDSIYNSSRGGNPISGLKAGKEKRGSDSSVGMVISNQMSKFIQTMWMGVSLLATALRTLKRFTKWFLISWEVHFYSQSLWLWSSLQEDSWKCIFLFFSIWLTFNNLWETRILWHHQEKKSLDCQSLSVFWSDQPEKVKWKETLPLTCKASMGYILWSCL